MAILLVDDDPGTLVTFDRILRCAGFEVTIAASGRDGLRLAFDQRFEAIIADLQLPDMTAVDMLAAMRARRVDVPVVVVTGFGTVEAAVQSLKLGAVDFVEKPLSDTDLVRLTQSAVTSQVTCNAKASPSDLEATFDLRVHSALLIIDDSFRNSALRTRDVALDVGVSTEHLCRLIKLHTGRSFRSHLTARRIQAAQTLLAESTFSVKEIADRVGFGSTNRMDESFRKICGVNPKAYRRRARLSRLAETAAS